MEYIDETADNRYAGPPIRTPMELDINLVAALVRSGPYPRARGRGLNQTPKTRPYGWFIGA